MRKYWVLLLVVICNFNVNSQNIQFGLEFSPKITKQHFTNLDNNRGPLPPIEAESSTFLGGSAGVSIFININERVRVKSGISLNRFTLKQNDYSYQLRSDLNIKSSWVSSKYTLVYLGIPIIVQRALTKNKSHPYLSLGGDILINISQNGTNKLYESQNMNGPIHKMPDDYLTPMNSMLIMKAGVGYEYHLKDKGELYIEANFGVSQNKIFKSVKATTAKSKIVMYEFVLGFKV